jgi:hypothetical protein
MVLVVSAFVVTGMTQAKMHEKMEKHHGKMDDVKLHVKLSGIPEVKTTATGKATFTMAKDGSSIHYKLNMDKIENVTMSHIHAVGEGGKRGPVIVWLYPSAGGGPSLKEGIFSGSLSETGREKPSRICSWGSHTGRPASRFTQSRTRERSCGESTRRRITRGRNTWGRSTRGRAATREFSQNLRASLQTNDKKARHSPILLRECRAF